MDTRKLGRLVKRGLFNASYFINYPLMMPGVLQISLTNRCNLRCKMCSVYKYSTPQDEEMTLEEVEKIITVAKKQFGIKELILTGGEPLLLGDIVTKIAEFARERDIRTTLTTNGFLFKKHAERLAGSGIVHFHVSVDGLEETHNHLRGHPESFARAIESIKLLAEIREKYHYCYSIGLAMLILKENIDEITELYHYADKLHVDIFDLLPYLPDNTDFSSAEINDLWPDDETVEKFVHIYKKIYTEKTKCVRLNPNFDMELSYKYYKKNMQPRDWRCFAGYKNFFITMSDPKRQGRYEPCLFMCKTHIPLKDYAYDLKKIWYSSQAYMARVKVRNCKSYCYQMCFSLPSLKKLLKS